MRQDKFSPIKAGDLIVFDKFDGQGPTFLNEGELALVLDLINDGSPYVLQVLTAQHKLARFTVFTNDKFRIIAKFVDAEF